MPDRCHDVSEDTKLVEISHLDAELKRFLYLYVCQLEYEGDTFQTVAHELGQIIVEVLVDHHQIVFEVVRDLVQVEEDLLEVLFDQSQQAHQFHVAESAHNVVCDRVELVADEEREFDVELAQGIDIVSLTTAREWHLLQFNLPVTEHSLDQKVKTNEELNYLLIFSALLHVKAVSKVIHLQYLSRQPVHLLLL